MIETTELYKYRCKELIKEGLALCELNEYVNFKNIMSKYEFETIMKGKQNRKNKRYRTKQKYIELLKIRNALKMESTIVFGTITLDDKHLSQKEDTYIRKIHKWLQSHFIFAILNKDYGGENEREHYHFIGLTTEDMKIAINEKTGKPVKSLKGIIQYNLTKVDYKLGHEPNLEIIKMEEEDIDKTVNYLLKLNNHSNKVGTKSRVRIVKSADAKMVILLNALEESKGEKNFKKFIREYVN